MREMFRFSFCSKEVQDSVYTRVYKYAHDFEPFFGQLLVIQSSNKIHPSNRIDHSNNISKGQDKRISNLEVRAGQSFGFEKTL